MENNAVPPRHTLAAGRCLVNPQIDCWLLLEDTAIENSSRKKLSTMWLRRQKCLPLSIYESMHCFLFFSFFESVENDPIGTPHTLFWQVPLIYFRNIKSKKSEINRIEGFLYICKNKVWMTGELILKKKNIFLFQNTNGNNRYLEDIEFCKLWLCRDLTPISSPRTGWCWVAVISCSCQ